jgi:hypothetical protein
MYSILDALEAYEDPQETKAVTRLNVALPLIIIMAMLIDGNDDNQYTRLCGLCTIYGQRTPTSGSIIPSSSSISSLLRPSNRESSKSSPPTVRDIFFLCIVYTIYCSIHAYHGPVKLPHGGGHFIRFLRKLLAVYMLGIIPE